MSAAGRTGGRRRVLTRLYLYGVALVALMWLALFGVGRLVVAPAINASVRPLAGWIVPRVAATRADPVRLRAETDEVKQKLKIDLTLYDASGRLLSTNVDPPLPALGPEDLARLEDEPAIAIGDTPVVAAAVLEGRELVAYGLVVRPPRNLTLKASSFAFLAVLVVLAFGAVPLARSIVGPLERLAAVTRAFGEGDLRARAGSYQRDEIGDLARAFDVMAERVAFLLRAEKELLANVSHELRTPLARIRVALDLAERGDPARAQRYLAEIAEDLSELDRLVDDVLTAARLDLAEERAGEGQPPLRIADVEAGDLVERAAARFADRHPDRTLAVDAGALPTIRADETLLRRAIDNLLENAQKYSDPGSPIELRASCDDRRLLVEVADHGIGIDAADLPSVFKPFFRGDRSRARTTGGVGLGLALTRRIVEAHEGTIALDSRVGVGTTARIELPIGGRGGGERAAAPA